VPTSAEDVWKAEYEAHVAEWRARSAEQREKAEAERARWEAIRAEEEKAGKQADARAARLSDSAVSEWESVKAATESRASPSPADARDLVTGEKQGRRHVVCFSFRGYMLMLTSYSRNRIPHPQSRVLLRLARGRAGQTLSRSPRSMTSGKTFLPSSPRPILRSTTPRTRIRLLRSTVIDTCSTKVHMATTTMTTTHTGITNLRSPPRRLRSLTRGCRRRRGCWRSSRAWPLTCFCRSSTASCLASVRSSQRKLLLDG
jgi:hypothetical protein